MQELTRGNLKVVFLFFHHLSPARSPTDRALGERWHEYGILSVMWILAEATEANLTVLQNNVRRYWLLLFLDILKIIGNS